jgi:hypothetical protein
MPGAPNPIDFADLVAKLEAPPISKPHTYLHIDLRVLSLPMLQLLLGDLSKRRSRSERADAAIAALEAHIAEREAALDAASFVFEG